MPKTKIEKKPVRLLRRGDVVKTPQGDEEVVRKVQVVLWLANGQSVTYEATESLEVLPPEELPELEKED